MKAIIDGKRYDTVKANWIGEGQSSCGQSDFKWYSEDLYQTPRSKAFFLAGRGGPSSKYCRSVGDGWTGGSAIFPLDPDEALEWAENNMHPDDIEAAFADEIEDA